MGWTVLDHRPAGLTAHEFFEREFPESLGGGKMLASATAPQEHNPGSTFYAAVRANDGHVWGLVVLMAKRGQTGFAYKEMDETMGPSERRCPAHVLDLLTPTDAEYANTWRELCRAYNASEAARPKVKEGDTVRFAQPLEFTSGDKHQELTLQSARRAVFTAANGKAYRLGRSWKRDLKFEVVA